MRAESLGVDQDPVPDLHCNWPKQLPDTPPESGFHVLLDIASTSALRGALYPQHTVLYRRVAAYGDDGLVYSLQRTYAEVLLALRLHTEITAVALARNEQSPSRRG
jgi:hypothetical protein